MWTFRYSLWSWTAFDSQAQFKVSEWCLSASGFCQRRFYLTLEQKLRNRNLSVTESECGFVLVSGKSCRSGPTEFTGEKLRLMTLLNLLCSSLSQYIWYFWKCSSFLWHTVQYYTVKTWTTRRFSTPPSQLLTDWSVWAQQVFTEVVSNTRVRPAPVESSKEKQRSSGVCISGKNCNVLNV